MVFASLVDIISMKVHRLVWIFISIIGLFNAREDSFKAVLVIGIPLFILALFRQLGGGDVKYAMAFGLCLGTVGVVTGTAIAYILAAIVIPLFRKLRNKSITGKYPMIPFLSIGYAVVLWTQYYIL